MSKCLNNLNSPWKSIPDRTSIASPTYYDKYGGAGIDTTINRLNFHLALKMSLPPAIKGRRLKLLLKLNS